MPRKSTKTDPSRPLKVCSIEELTQLYAQNRYNPTALKIIEQELFNRKPSATELLRQHITQDLYGVPVVKHEIVKTAPTKTTYKKPAPSLPEAIVFKCGCGTRVRVPFKSQAWVIACPKCNTKYDCEWQKETCLLQKQQIPSTSSSDSTIKSKEQAIKYLEGVLGEPLLDSRVAKKKLMQAFHPDKYVAAPSLIQKFAESEFKKIMQAFSFLNV